MSHTNASHNQMNAENQNIEYKESWRDEYLKWICGFANAQGGKSKLHEPHASNARNKNIAFAFYKAGFIEAWGRGISKIVTQFTAAGLKEPKFEDFCGGVRVTIYRNTDLVAETIEKNNGEVTKRVTVNDGEVTQKVTVNDGEVTPKVTVNVNEDVEKDVEIAQKIAQKNVQKIAQKNAQKIFACIKRNSLITIAEMSKRTRLSVRSVNYYIEQLKQQGLIIRIGPDKGGHWEIIKQNNNN